MKILYISLTFPGDIPYGDGKASEKIIKILEDIEIGDKLLNKRFIL